MKRIVALTLLMAASLAAMAQTFSATVPSGQTLTFSVTSSTTVQVPMQTAWISGALEIPATVSNGSNTYSVTAIATSAFNGKGLTSLVLPEGLKTIGNGAFSGNNNLASITLPATLTAIGSLAFTGTAFFNNPDNLSADGLLYCNGYIIGMNNTLTQGHILVADGTRGLADNVFLRSPLTAITFPASMRFVGNGAFPYCNNLDSVIMLGSTPPTHGTSSASLPSSSVVVSVPCGTLAAYRAAGWGSYALVEDCSGDNPGDDPGDDPGDNPGDDPGDDPNGIANLDPLSATIATTAGGILLHSEHRMQYLIVDAKGVVVASPVVCGSTHVALPASGLYVVSAAGCKAVKVSYQK